MIKALMISLISTWILELGFAWMLNLRSKEELKLVLLVNFITNPAVVSLYWMFYQVIDPVFLIVCLETAAIFTEAVYYREFADRINHPFLFSLCVNLFSYLTGVLVQMF